MATEFKVGDRVRHLHAADGFAGKVAEVIEVNGGYVTARLPNGVEGMGRPDYWELVADPTDELAELRAFKETALAAGYVPPEPVDGDLDDAEAAWAEWRCDASTGPFAFDAMLFAIKWARANPR